MDKLEQYKIDLKNLAPGVHSFTYSLDDNFFEYLEEDLVRKGTLKVELTVKRLSEVFEMNFQIAGNVWVPCDRCLEDVKVPVETVNRLIVKFGEEYSEESEEVVIVPEEEGAINVAWFMYEFIALAIPMKHVHAEGECNEEMASKLKEHMAVDFDENQSDERDTDAIDPRWEGLKNWIENNNN